MNSKIRFGIVGTNFISDYIVAAGKEDDRFEAVAVCSRSQEKGSTFAAAHNIPHIFTSPQEMARSPLLDAVYVASPNSLHHFYSMLFMRHGKHVLCEKPFASNAREAEQMIEASVKYNVTLMEAMKQTVTPNFRALEENLYRVGGIRAFSFSCCKYSIYYDHFKEGSLPNLFNPALSNGALMDLGCYPIFPAVALFGKPKDISASATILSSGTDAEASAHLQYDNMSGTISCSAIFSSDLPSRIEGENGTIFIDKISRFEKITFSDGLTQELVDISSETPHNIYYYELAEFMNLIQDRRRESQINSHQNSLHCMEVMDHIRRQTGVVFPADDKIL